MRKEIICILLLVFLLNSCLSSAGGKKSLDDLIESKAIKLESASDMDRLIEIASKKKLVLLGEASHGTHEYYTWRDSISRRLIEEHGFNFILVEGDFASLYELNRYVKGMPGAANSAREVLLRLDRWPLWMWGNYEVLELTEWLREYNMKLPLNKRVGFYGMDVYDEWKSKYAILNALKDEYPGIYRSAEAYLSCFKPYEGNSWNYANDEVGGRINCSDNPTELVNMLIAERRKLRKMDKAEYFYLLQNAFVFKNAEKFYRKSVAGLRSESWNARAIHMHKTSVRLMSLYGKDSNGIVWAHNTHIGDASYTDMKTVNQTNIGEMSRAHFGDKNVLLVGFTTYQGKVLAGSQWGSPVEEMNIIPAQLGSIEEILNRVDMESFYLIFDDEVRNHTDFLKPMGNRAIGVVYNPNFDFRQFVNTVVPMRYDALIFFKETKALKALH